MASARRPRLLLLAPVYPPAVGGIQTLMHELSHGLSSQWSITVIAPYHPRSSEYDSGAPFRVLRTHSGWNHSRLAVLGEMIGLAAVQRADIVLVGHVNALPAAMTSSRGVTRAALVYGSEIWAPRTRLLMRTLGPRLDLVMAVSRFTAGEVEKCGVHRNRIAVTAAGATTPIAPATSQDILLRLGLLAPSTGAVAPFFLTVSRLAEAHKGHDIFIRALPALLRRCPDVRYLIAGDGKLKDRLRILAERAGVGHAVIMPGFVDEDTKAALLHACRAFVMISTELRRPALFEGFGIAFMEAAMAGRPSLAGNSGGIPDAVVHQETGLLVDPLSLAEVTRGACLLLDNPTYASALGDRARARAIRSYTWKAALSRIERCLQEALR